MIWFCYNTYFPQTQARVYRSIQARRVLNRMNHLLFGGWWVPALSPLAGWEPFHMLILQDTQRSQWEPQLQMNIKTNNNFFYIRTNHGTIHNNITSLIPKKQNNNIYILTRTVMKYHVSVDCQASYIFPKGLYFSEMHSTEGKYNYLGTTDTWYFIRPGRYLLY